MIRNAIILILSLSSIAAVTGCSDEPMSFTDHVFEANQKQKELNLVDFAVIKTTILEPYCIKCHRRFADFNTVKARLASIQDSIVQNRMPQDAPALSADEKRLLNAWVLNGAPLTAVIE